MTGPAHVIGGQTITIVHALGRDHFGDPLPGVPPETDVPGCVVQPHSSTEDTAGRDTVATTLTVWCPPGTAVRPTDRVRYDSRTYAVDGRPALWVDLFGHEHHIQLQLRAVEG